jgi:hypothetical protein
MDYPHIPAGTLLKLGLKAMNITIGENGLVPSLLVFGVIPRYPALNTELPNQKVRMEVIAAAQMEMNFIIAERRISMALAKNSHLRLNMCTQSEMKCLPSERRKVLGPASLRLLQVQIRS